MVLRGTWVKKSCEEGSSAPRNSMKNEGIVNRIVRGALLLYLAIAIAPFGSGYTGSVKAKGIVSGVASKDRQPRLSDEVTNAIIKPDLVAPGNKLIEAMSPSKHGRRRGLKRWLNPRYKGI
jgi:hypothetical protein